MGVLKRFFYVDSTTFMGFIVFNATIDRLLLLSI